MGGQLGRPRKYNSVEDFDLMVDLYVAECAENDEPLCITGLILYLGFTSEQSLNDYGKRKGFEEFAASVKRARMLVRNSYEKKTLNGGGAGPIFLLKASYGYTETQVVKSDMTVKFSGKYEDV